MIIDIFTKLTHAIFWIPFFAEVIEVDFSVDFGQIMHIFLHNQAI